MEFISYVPGEVKRRRPPKFNVVHGRAKPVSSIPKTTQLDVRRNGQSPSDQSLMLDQNPKHSESFTEDTKSRAFRLLQLTLAHNRLLSKYGAFEAPTFNATPGSAAVSTADFMGTSVWPVVAGEAIAAAWFQGYCTSPVLFHAQCAASSAYRDLMIKKPLSINSAWTSFHKMRAIQIVQDSLADIASMSQLDLQSLIFAIMILGSHEATTQDLVDITLPFKSYFPDASLLNLWGRIDPIEAHDNAAFDLIERNGGLRNMKMPGLAVMAAFVDILRACTYCRKPRFPSFWDAHVFDLMPDRILPSLHGDAYSLELPGCGFARVPGGLTWPATSVFTQVATLDRLMNHFRDCPPTESEFRLLLDIRHATIHRLLSLLPWNELEPIEDALPGPLSYEVSRIATIIYCNAVIFSLPPHTGWDARYTAKLRSLLSSVAASKEWKSRPSSPYLWALFVGALAAQHTPYRSFFESSLRTVLSERGTGWDVVKKELKTFIWSDYVCEDGAKELWDKCVAGTPSEG